MASLHWKRWYLKTRKKRYYQSVQFIEEDEGLGMQMYVDMKPLMSDQVIEAFNRLIFNLKSIEWII